MKRFMRYGLVPAAIFTALLLVTIILAPILINFQRFVPDIERHVNEVTGRSFSLGTDLHVSFFPWLSLSLSDLRIGNPPEFHTNEFIKVKTLEARIKVLPLLRGQLEISRFVVDGLSVNLEKNEAGKVNWSFAQEGKSEGRTAESMGPFSGLFSERLSVSLLAVTDGKLVWNDRTKNDLQRVEDVMFLLNDFAPGRPFSLDCKAAFNGRSVAIEGRAGPFTGEKNKVVLPMDAAFSVMNRVHGKIQGTVSEQGGRPGFDLSLHIEPFAPRELASSLDVPFPFKMSQAGTFHSLGLQLSAQGSTNTLTIDKGVIHLDESLLNFSLSTQHGEHPRMAFNLGIDRLDLDRYLPGSQGGSEPGTAAVKSGQEDQSSVWSRDVQKFTVTGTIRVDEVQLHGGTLAELYLPVHGDNGLYTIEPVTFKVGKGSAEATAVIDLGSTPPAVKTSLKASGIEAETVFREFFGWDFLRGNLTAELTAQAVGTSFDAMVRSLTGEGSLAMQGGELVGLDSFGAAQDARYKQDTASTAVAGDRPTTVFTDAGSKLTINAGILEIFETSLHGPELQLTLNGSVDMVRRMLQLHLNADVLATTVGRDGRESAVNRTSFYSITGPFSQPELKSEASVHGPVSASRINVKRLVEEKLSSPVDDDVKDLVGKNLVDPAVVAQRFQLQPETLRRDRQKKMVPVGSGRVVIKTLREEAALQ